MSLRASLGAGGMSPAGGLAPVPAGQATGPRSSTAAAYGIGAGTQPGAATAFIGTTTVAGIAAVILLWLWWSLPR